MKKWLFLSLLLFALALGALAQDRSATVGNDEKKAVVDAAASILE